MEINNIKTIAEKLYKDIELNGIEAIKKLFLKGTNLSEELRFNPLEEYVKKMLISQMDIDKMLFYINIWIPILILYQNIEKTQKNYIGKLSQIIF